MKATRIMASLAILIAVFFAQQNPARAEYKYPTLATVEEILLKGSVDGKHLWMVLGVKDAADIDKNVIKNHIGMEDLRQVSRTVYNKDHEFDVYGNIKGGWKFGRGLTHDLLQSAWKDLKDIPGSFEAEIELGNYAYHNASNPVAGTVKWSGHAIWATVKGAYYLVVQVPVEAVIGTTGPAIGVTGGAALSTLEIGISGVWFGIKLAYTAVAVAGTSAYSAVTAGGAATGALILAGGVGVVRAVHWVVVTGPRKLKYPVSGYTDMGQPIDKKDEVAASVEKLLNDSSFTGVKDLSAKQVANSRFSTTLELAVEGLRLGTADIFARQGDVRVRLSVRRDFIKAYAQSNNMSVRNAKAVLKGLVTDLLSRMKQPAPEATVAAPATAAAQPQS